MSLTGMSDGSILTAWRVCDATRKENEQVRLRGDMCSGLNRLVLIAALAVSLAPEAVLGTDAPAPAPEPGIPPANEPAAPRAGGILNPATTPESVPVDPVPGDDALRSYLGQSDLVVVGEMLFASGRSVSPDPFRVSSTIKGEAQPQILIAGGSGFLNPHVDPVGQMVLFLWKSQVPGGTNLEAFWRPRDAQFGAMPATPGLVASLKRLEAAQTTNSGEDQLRAIMRRFVPNCSLRELKYKIGDQTYSTAVLAGLGQELDRRDMKWVAGGSRQAPANVTVMHCPKLTGALWEHSDVHSARDAEDYVRLVFGLCAGPRALEYWKVKAAPLGDGWLVTPVYVGPQAPVRSVGPMELVWMNKAAGKVVDICEWRPNFNPGQTARLIRPTGMEPDGLDPAPAELDDPTLDSYLSKSEMVVVGKAMNDVGGGFIHGMRLHLYGEFKIIETIKGKAVSGSTIQVQVSQEHLFTLKKDEQLILFLSYHGGTAREGAESIPVWDTDDYDFGALPASTGVVSALKRLAAARGDALETPNLYWGAEVDGISVRLDTFGLGSSWRAGRDFALNIAVANHGTNSFSFERDRRGGELEVDGVWYSWPNPTNMFVIPSDAAVNLFSEIKVLVGSQWRVRDPGGGRPDGVGAPLILAPGAHKIRFALIARRLSTAGGSGPASEFRAVSHPVDIEVREDTTRPNPQPRSPRTGIPPQAPVGVAGEYQVDGEIVDTLYKQDGGIQLVQRSKFTVFVKDCSWLIQTTDHDEAGSPTIARETGCANGGEIYQVDGPVKKESLVGGMGEAGGWNFASVFSNTVPVGPGEGRVVGHLWMMFASGCYFANLSNNWVKPVYDLNALEDIRPDYMKEAAWKLLGGAGSLPSNVLFADARYVATGVTNAGNVLIPSGFVFEQRVNGDTFKPVPLLPGDSVPAYHIRQQAVATVTAIRPVCSRDDLLPSAAGFTTVVDHRVTPVAKDGESPMFAADEFLVFPKLARILVRHTNDVSACLWQSLSPPDQALLTNFQPSGATFIKAREVVVDALNKVVQGPCFYESNRFHGIALRSATTNLMAQAPTGDDLGRLNRMLLVDAFPDEFVAPAPLTTYSFQKGVQWLPVEKARQLSLEQRAPKRGPSP
jgi:hypothetical protein